MSAQLHLRSRRWRHGGNLGTGNLKRRAAGTFGGGSGMRKGCMALLGGSGGIALRGGERLESGIDLLGRERKRCSGGGALGGLGAGSLGWEVRGIATGLLGKRILTVGCR